MQEHNDSLLMDDEAVVTRRRLPFGFAKRHQVVFLQDEERLLYREGVALQSIAEARRFLQQPFSLEAVEPARARRLLLFGERAQHAVVSFRAESVVV